ncbi:hypothetical protein E2I00_002202, partial [Balaenoptera physalus]
MGQSWSLVCKLRYHRGDRIQHGMATIRIRKGTVAFFSDVVSPSILRHRRRERYSDLTSAASNPPLHQPGQGSLSARAAGAPGTARPRLAASIGSPRRGAFPRSQVPRLRTIRPSKCGAGEADGKSDTQRLTSRPGGPRRVRGRPLRLLRGSGPCPGTFDVPRRPLMGPGRGTSGRALGSYGRQKQGPQSGRSVSHKQLPGSEGTPGPQQARAEGSGSGLGAAGRAAGERQSDDTTGGAGAASLMAPSSPRLRVRARCRPVPGPRLNQVAPTVGSCAWGGWGQLLVLPGPAVTKPGHASGTVLGAHCWHLSARFVLFTPRRPQPSTLRPQETQEQPQAADSLHHRAAAGAGG